MASADAEIEQQLKEAGKQLSHPPDSVDELLHLLGKVEKLLSMVDQLPKKSRLDAMNPSKNVLIQDSLSKHSDIDVKVAVASCIIEITRITAPNVPYPDDQMRDVLQLIVSSFEDLADKSSRSYNKRASILKTFSKIRACVIMVDLECVELIVKMFDHFLKAVRDYHIDFIFSSMEDIMVMVIKESEEISFEMLRPLMASVKKDREGVLPVAHMLGKGVLLKSAEKLKPYMRPALTSLGESLDMYHKVVAAVCEGTAIIENKDDDDSGAQLANECKLEKGSVYEAQQVDESKLTTSLSEHVEQVIKAEETCPKEEVDPTVENRSPKAVMSNGVSDTIRYDESLVGTKLKVWWPEDKMYYEGVVAEFYAAKKKHKVSYVDGDEETMNLRKQRWKILKEFSVRNDGVQNTVVRGEEGSPEIHQKERSKTDPAASNEKIKDSAKKSKGSIPNDNKSTQKPLSKSCDAAATTSKEIAKSKEDEETLKTSSKTKTNGLTKAEKMDDDKEKEVKKLRLEDKRLRLEAEKFRIKAEKERSKIRQEDERLRLEAEKMKFLKEESDQRIMMMDVKVMSEMQRLYFEELQRKIIMRTRNP